MRNLGREGWKGEVGGGRRGAGGSGSAWEEAKHGLCPV